MTKKEALQILAILKAAYPSSYNGMTKEEASGTVAVWMIQFAEIPVDIVMMAVQKCISTKNFPPTVSEVKSKIQSIHWEAYEMISGNFNEHLSEADRKKYRRIYEATEDYKHGGRFAELPLSQMLSSGMYDGAPRLEDGGHALPERR